MTMCTLVRETTSLHKVIAKYLPPESLRSIMSQIFRSYVKRLDDDLKKVDLFSSAGKNRQVSFSGGANFSMKAINRCPLFYRKSFKT